jgi:hypothetical protein
MQPALLPHALLGQMPMPIKRLLVMKKTRRIPVMKRAMKRRKRIPVMMRRKRRKITRMTKMTPRRLRPRMRMWR